MKKNLFMFDVKEQNRLRATTRQFIDESEDFFYQMERFLYLEPRPQHLSK